MADVYDYRTLDGTIVPDAADIQSAVQEEYKQAFGQDLNVDPNTPEGVLITAETLARIAVADNNAGVANQVNPNIAGGIFLDALCALTGLYRTPETFSQVVATVAGLAGTIIPSASLAQDAAGNQWQTITQVTLTGSPAQATVTFECLSPGAVTVDPGDLNTIVTAIVGWETVTNPAAQFALGAETQSDASLRRLRQQTLGLQAQSIPVAIIGALLDPLITPGVTAVSFLENVASTTEVIQGVTMVPHSIYVCVQGGDNEDIAATLTDKKSMGCAYNNGASSDPQTVTYTVPISGQEIDVLFDRPDIIPINVRITVLPNSTVQDPTTIVKKAITDYAQGLLPNSETGLTIGTDVSAFEIAGAVNVEVPGIFVTLCEIKKVSDPSYDTATIPISIFELASIEASGITVLF